jgi:hypothetical protein
VVASRPAEAIGMVGSRSAEVIATGHDVRQRRFGQGRSLAQAIGAGARTTESPPAGFGSWREVPAEAIGAGHEVSAEAIAVDGCRSAGVR